MVELGQSLITLSWHTYSSSVVDLDLAVRMGGGGVEARRGGHERG